MPQCVVAARDPDARERAARILEAEFEHTIRASLADLPSAVARERPDVVLVVAEPTPPKAPEHSEHSNSSGGSGAAWVTAVAELHTAEPELAVLVTAAPQIAVGDEPSLAATALVHGAHGYLRAARHTDLQPPRPPLPEQDSTMSGLSARERQILHGIAEGLTNPAIAAELYVSEDTIKTHARRLFGKLGATDRADAVARAFRQGLLR